MMATHNASLEALSNEGELKLDDSPMHEMPSESSKTPTMPVQAVDLAAAVDGLQ